MYPVSATFLDELAKPVHSFRARMTVLDTDFAPVVVFDDQGNAVSPSETMIDGAVDVDVTRQTRRTFTATVLNPDGLWSPQSDWSGTFYVNRLIRMWRGINYGGHTELVCAGTFMIDHADTAVERNMSVVTLSGSDLWKKFGKSVFPRNKKWSSGTPLNTVISDMATAAGVTMTSLDHLDGRSAADKNLSRALSLEQGDNRGDALFNLCRAHAIDVYFDPMGRLVTQDTLTTQDREVVFTYDTLDGNNLITLKTSYSDDNLYNTVLVLGTKNKENIVVSRISDTDPDSITSVDRIGERVFKFESDFISTQAQADMTARNLFRKHIRVTEDITLETICNPAFEGNDVIRVREPSHSLINGKYRIKAFTVPMSTSRQTIRLIREINMP